jgi:hypothetical protein
VTSLPTQSDIDAALDILDGLELRQLQELRYHVSKTIRACQRPTAGAASAVSPPWPAVERALFYVLWTTSTEYLEHALITPAQ